MTGSVAVVKFEAQHMAPLLEQEGNAFRAPIFSPDILKFLEENEHSYTGFIDGEVVFCTGLIPFNKHRAEAWTVLHQNKKRDFVRIVNTIRKWLDRQKSFRRIEAVIDYEFMQGHRWIRALGFQLEALKMKGYRADGGDASLYARVSEWA